MITLQTNKPSSSGVTCSGCQYKCRRFDREPPAPQRAVPGKNRATVANRSPVNRSRSPAWIPADGPHKRSAHHTAAAARAMEAAWTLPACPLRQRRQGSGRAAAQSLPPLPQRASVGVFHAFPFHGTPHRSLLRDPLPGAAYPMGSRPMAMSASPPPSVAAASRSKSSA